MNARFHEWPLVAFTTLAVMGAGLMTSPLVAAMVGQSAAAASSLALPGTALLAAGLAVSLAHLGQPRRAPLAFARVGRSRLSTEILLASITLAAGLAASLFPHASPVTMLLPSACALAFLVSLGLVYGVPGQLAWRGVAIASPVVLGVGFAALGLAAAWSRSSPWNPASAGWPVAAAALAADVTLFLWRWRTLAQAGESAPHILATRLVLVDVLPGCLLLAGLPKGAVAMLGLGILVDRLSFYLLARQHTTEAEIARVEELLAGGDGTR